MSAHESGGRWRSRWWLAVYLLLLASSQLWTAIRSVRVAPRPPGSERVGLVVGAAKLSALNWSAAPADGDHLPVLLLHGSPGAADNMAALGLHLAQSGREVLALDLPGFGASADFPGGRSMEAHALAALDGLAWPQFHVLAWSMGAGVALHMAELDPARVRSLVLVAGLGVQEAEGSGNYAFEHLKYALSWVLLVPGAEFIPHFGLLGDRASRRGFCLNFWESDQRPLRGILERLSLPVLIAHGRDDFLVPLWCAQTSHELLRDSRLVVLAGGHFLLFEPPFGQLDQLAPEVDTFLARHDRLGLREPRAFIDHSSPESRAAAKPYALQRALPWWFLLACCALVACVSPSSSGAAVGALAATLQLDLGLGLIGAALGAALCAAWRRRFSSWLRALAAICCAALVAGLLAAWTVDFFSRRHGASGGILLSTFAALAGVHALRLAFSYLRSTLQPRVPPATGSQTPTL